MLIKYLSIDCKRGEEYNIVEEESAMRKKDGPLKKMISIKLEPELIKNMKSYAGVLGMSTTALIEKSVTEYMANHQISDDLREDIQALAEMQEDVHQRIKDTIG